MFCLISHGPVSYERTISVQHNIVYSSWNTILNFNLLFYEAWHVHHKVHLWEHGCKWIEGGEVYVVTLDQSCQVVHSAVTVGANRISTMSISCKKLAHFLSPTGTRSPITSGKIRPNSHMHL